LLFVTLTKQGCMVVLALRMECTSCVSPSHKLYETNNSFNITTNHRRLILATTSGHPSIYNDKTLIRFDTFVSGIHQGDLYQDIKFNLLEKKRKRDCTTANLQRVLDYLQ
jgi:hypothetical protein